MPGRIGGQHAGRAAAYLINVVDLPGGVVQILRGRGADHEVVVVGGAADELADAADRVADLEPEYPDEQPLAGLDVGAADHDVTKPPWPHSAFAYRAGCPLVHSRIGARPVRGRGRGGLLTVPGGDRHPGPDAAAAVGYRDGVRISLVLEPGLA